MNEGDHGTITAHRDYTGTMKSSAEYRAYAEKCVEWAKDAHSQEERAALLEMARTWLDAAHTADRLRLSARTTARP